MAPVGFRLHGGGAGLAQNTHAARAARRRPAAVQPRTTRGRLGLSTHTRALVGDWMEQTTNEVNHHHTARFLFRLMKSFLFNDNNESLPGSVFYSFIQQHCPGSHYRNSSVQKQFCSSHTTQVVLVSVRNG